MKMYMLKIYGPGTYSEEGPLSMDEAKKRARDLSIKSGPHGPYWNQTVLVVSRYGEAFVWSGDAADPAWFSIVA